MANRRNFSKEITSSDVFVEMPGACQLLYFHLGMEADETGLVIGAKKWLRAYGVTEKELLFLITIGLVSKVEKNIKMALTFDEWRGNRGGQ